MLTFLAQCCGGHPSSGVTNARRPVKTVDALIGLPSSEWEVWSPRAHAKLAPAVINNVCPLVLLDLIPSGLNVVLLTLTCNLGLVSRSTSQHTALRSPYLTSGSTCQAKAHMCNLLKSSRSDIRPNDCVLTRVARSGGRLQTRVSGQHCDVLVFPDNRAWFLLL